MAGGNYSDLIVTGHLDLSRSHANREECRSLVAAESVLEEGLPIVREGTLVKTATGANGEIWYGLSKLDSNVAPDDLAIVEELTVPAAGALTLTLAHPLLVAGQIRILNVTENQALTEGDPANNNEYSVNDTTGVVTFHAGETGDAVRIWYRYNLTAVEQGRIFGARHINHGSSTILSSITVYTGPGVMYTNKYDVTQAWTAGATVYVGAGLLTLSNAAGAKGIAGTVESVPTIADPYLGLRMNAPV